MRTSLELVTEPPPPPAHAKHPSPAVTDEFIQKQFGDNCSLVAGPEQFVADLDGDGIDDDPLVPLSELPEMLMASGDNSIVNAMSILAVTSQAAIGLAMPVRSTVSESSNKDNLRDAHR